MLDQETKTKLTDLENVETILRSITIQTSPRDTIDKIQFAFNYLYEHCDFEEADDAFVLLKAVLQTIEDSKTLPDNLHSYFLHDVKNRLWDAQRTLLTEAHED